MTSALEQGYAAVGNDGAEVIVVVLPAAADIRDVIASRTSKRCSPISPLLLSGPSPGCSLGVIPGIPIGFESLGDTPPGSGPLSGVGSVTGFCSRGRLAQDQREECQL